MPLPQELIDGWNDVQIVVIDQESFLNRLKYDDLDRLLCEIEEKDWHLVDFLLFLLVTFISLNMSS